MEQRGVLLTAIMAYQTETELPEMDGTTNMCFMFIRQRIDLDNETYDKRCKKNTENIRKRWSTNESKDIPNDTNVYERIPNDTTETVGINSYSDSDSDNDSDKRKKGTSYPKKEMEREINAMGFDPGVELILKDWIAYKIEKRQGYHPTGFKNLMSRVKKEEQSHGSQAVIDSVQEAMANGWQGIAWNRISGRSPNDSKPIKRAGFVNYDQRQTDYDKMIDEGYR